MSTARDDVYQGMPLVLEKLVPSEKEQSWLSQDHKERWKADSKQDGDLFKWPSFLEGFREGRPAQMTGSWNTSQRSIPHKKSLELLVFLMKNVFWVSHFPLACRYFLELCNGSSHPPTTQYRDLFPAAHFEVSASELVLSVVSPGAWAESSLSPLHSPPQMPFN